MDASQLYGREDLKNFCLPNYSKGLKVQLKWTFKLKESLKWFLFTDLKKKKEGERNKQIKQPCL